MAENQRAENSTHDKSHRVEHTPDKPAPQEGLYAPELPVVSPGLLGDPRLDSRGNRPVKTAVLQRMQRTYGNSATRRFLQRTSNSDVASPPENIEQASEAAEGVPVQTARAPGPASAVSVQRDGPPAAAPAGGGPSVLDGAFFKIPLKYLFKMDVPLKPVPLKFVGVEVGAEATVKKKPDAAPAPAPGASSSSSSGPTVTVASGPSVGGSGGNKGGGGLDVSYKGEVEVAWKERQEGIFKGITPKVKGTGEASKDGVAFGIEATAESGPLSGTLRFTPYELKQGQTKILNAGYKVTYKPPAQEFKISSGITVVVETEGYVELQFEPDWKAIIEYIARTIGKEALTSMMESVSAAAVPVAGAAAAGLAAAGFLVGTMYLMDDAGKKGVESGQAAAAAGAKAQSYALSFASVATGGGPKGGEGGAKGAEDARAEIDKQINEKAASIPQAEKDLLKEKIVAASRQKGQNVIAKEAYVVIAQQIYDKATADYREAHKGEVSNKIGNFFGIDDLGTGLGLYQKNIAIVLENKTPGGGPLSIKY